MQFGFREGEGGDAGRLRAVREAISRTWEGYVEEAWGWDEVRPVAGGGKDTRYSPPHSTPRPKKSLDTLGL